MNDKIVMTKEMKDQLVGLLPMSGDRPHEYTPEIFEKAEEQFRPVFYIKQLSNDQVLRVKEMILKEVNSTKKKWTIRDISTQNTAYMEILHTALVGWDNLIDLGVMEYKEYDGSYDMMVSLPESILTDILGEVFRITGFVPHGV